MQNDLDDFRRELQHQRKLLNTHTSSLQVTEEQIAFFGPAAIPLHLWHQREWAEAERTKALQKIQELEQRLGDEGQRVSESRHVGTPQVIVEVLLSMLPTGLLHLYSRDSLPLLKYRVSNPSNIPKTVILTSWIEQFSFTRTDTIPVKPGHSQMVAQLPVLKLDEIASIYEVRKAVLHTRASYLDDGHESLLFLQDYDIQFLARDALVWAIIVDDATVHDLSHHVAAWVTPNVGPVVEMLRHAADCHPARQMWGYQGDGAVSQRATIVREQVEAIFLALKEKGEITYINAPISFGRKANEVQQRVNLPADSLAHRQANCIDGAVLYASLIERAAMNPVIVIVPGHAFVGWETWAGSGQYEFLETTMTGSHAFEDAFNQGMCEFAAAQPSIGRPLFDAKGFAVMLDVKALRLRGVIPL